jgi:integrase
MPMRRGPRKRGWPERLYERDGYFSYRDPLSGRELGLGRNRQAAFAQAVEANLHVAGVLSKARLVDRITKSDNQTLSDWCDKYQGILDDRELAKETRSEWKRRLRIVREGLGTHKIDLITVKDIADFLGTWEAAGKKRMAQAMRSFMLDLFREAQAAGWVQNNPVAPTRAARVKVQRARLSLDDFKAIHAYAVQNMPAWVVRSMELALVTGQRLEDIASLGRKDLSDGRLRVVQGKTGAHVAIPLELRLQAVNWSVGEVIERCQHRFVVSKTFIHHTSHIGKAKPGAAVRETTISQKFAKCRDGAGVRPPAGKTATTFHEIRSLAARLYTEQGINAQPLLGHKSADMTSVYRDVRGSEWIEVQTG